MMSARVLLNPLGFGNERNHQPLRSACQSRMLLIILEGGIALVCRRRESKTPPPYSRAASHRKALAAPSLSFRHVSGGRLAS